MKYKATTSRLYFRAILSLSCLICAGLTALTAPGCSGPPADFEEHALEPIGVRISIPKTWKIRPLLALEQGPRIELIKAQFYEFGDGEEKGIVGQFFLVPKNLDQAAEDCRSAGGGYSDIIERGETSEDCLFVVCSGSIGGKPTRIVHSYLSKPGHRSGVWCRYEGFTKWDLFQEACKSLSFD